MKLLASIVAALAALAVAGAASASIPGDGGYTDGLRVVYPTPITAGSVAVHERYYLCRGVDPVRAPRAGAESKTTRATAEKWCRFMPSVRGQPPAADTAMTEPQGEILSVPVRDWTPL
jgi:hypothetical protein